MSSGEGPEEPHHAAGEEMSREELASRLADPSLVVVNVLPREAFAVARIPGSRSLPLADVAARAPRLLPDRRAEIAVYCGGPT